MAERNDLPAPQMVRPNELPASERADIADAIRGRLGVDALLDVLQQCLEATHRGQPDYRTRMSATTLALAYAFGKPVERRLEARTSADAVAGGKSAGGLTVEKLLGAPAAVDALLEALLSSAAGRRKAKALLGEGPAEAKALLGEGPAEVEGVVVEDGDGA